MNPPSAPVVSRNVAQAPAGFVEVCALERITVNRGVAALIDGVAVAVFRLDDDSLHAIDNVDPFSGASILSRGIIGDVRGEVTVASPMYKQRFSLTTGVCIEDPTVALSVHDVCCVGGRVVVQLGARQ